jgi:hypothetical protein
MCVLVHVLVASIVAVGGNSKSQAQWPSLSRRTCAKTGGPGVRSSLRGQRRLAKFGGLWYAIINRLRLHRIPSLWLRICGRGVAALGCMRTSRKVAWILLEGGLAGWKGIWRKRVPPGATAFFLDDRAGFRRLSSPAWKSGMRACLE